MKTYKEFASLTNEATASLLRDYFKTRYDLKYTGVLSMIEEGGYFVVVRKTDMIITPAEFTFGSSIYRLSYSRKLSKELGASYMSLKKYIDMLKKGGWL